MDNHFLLLLRKDDFIDFYCYGRWKAQCPFIKFDGSIESLVHDKKAMDNLFKQANPFAYSMDYYLLHAICPKVSSIEIDDIIDVFALDKESYKIGLTLSPEITLREPIFEEHFVNFQIENEIADSKIGIDYIFSIFDINPPKFNIKKGDLEKIVHDSFLELPIEGSECIWYYLLRYERHQGYPRDNRGYALDALHALFNFQKRKEMDVSVTQSRIGKIIAEMKPGMNYKDTIAIISQQKDFIKQCEKLQKGYYRVAPLFLTLKDIFSEGFHEDKKYSGYDLPSFINALKKYDNEDLAKALYLLGIVLGRENTYQFMYRRKKLPILKK